MAGRPPLVIGTHGKILFSDVTKPGGPKTIRARAQFRDLDGHTRQVTATGPSNAAAERALKEKLASRSAPAVDDITPDTKIRVVAERWFATVEAAVEAGQRSPGTTAAYRSQLDRHVLPAVGELRLREATTGRLDAVLRTIRQKSGASTAKSCRTVLSGILGYAARMDAVSTNPLRNTSPIPTKPSKTPRALTVEECGRWLARLAEDPVAIRHDLVDLTGFLLATGVRIGEALAIDWDDVDLTGSALGGACTVKVDHTIIRVPGQGLVRKTVKTAAGLRTLRLPEFAVAMLRRRAIEMYALKIAKAPEGFLSPCQSDKNPGDVIPGQGGEAGGAEDRRSDFCPFLSPSPMISVSAGQKPAEAVFGTFVTGFGSESGEDGSVRAFKEALRGSPVFPDSQGGWRDPSNTRRDLRQARGEEFAWVTSHTFRKTAATMLDEAGLTARQIANQLGHARPSLTQDVYMGRGVVDPQVAVALDRVFGVNKTLPETFNHGEHLA